MHGSIAYDNKDWQAVIENMEESISAFLTATNQCRAQCEGPFDQGWYPDLIPSIASKCVIHTTEITAFTQDRFAAFCRPFYLLP